MSRKSKASGQPKKTSFRGFVIVNNSSVANVANKASSTSSSPSSSTPSSSNNTSSNLFNLPGYVWESKLTIEECCYHIILQAQDSFVVIFIDEDQLPTLAGTLRSLITSIITITMKTVRTQAAKILATSCTTGTSGVIILSPQMAVFLESCLPQKLNITHVIHIGGITLADFERRSLKSRPKGGGKGDSTVINQISVPQHIHLLVPDINRKLSKNTSPYEYNKLWTSVVQQRIATARKLYVASVEGKTLNQGKDEENLYSDFIEERQGKYGNNEMEIENNLRKGMAGKIEALKNKLKILLSIVLPVVKTSAKAAKESKDSKNSRMSECNEENSIIEEDSNENNNNDKTIENIKSTPTTNTTTPTNPEKTSKLTDKKDEKKDIKKGTKKADTIDSASVVREKMELLGMLAVPVKGGERHRLADKGRTLAATQWMDSATFSPSSTLSSSSSSSSISSCSVTSSSSSLVSASKGIEISLLLL